MSRTRAILQRLLTFAGLVTVGLVVFSWLESTRAAPRARAPKERGRAVRVIALEEAQAVPRAIGYGVVEAKRAWQAIAEVSGEVVELGEGVAPGRVVQEGATLLRIEPRSYELEESRTAATVKAVRAQIEELKAREQSARQNLKVEERVLELARTELARTRSLYESGSAPLMDVEAAERAALAAERSAQAFRNTLLELPATRKVLAAQLEQVQAGAKGAQISLAKTTVVAPFTMRIRELNVSQYQAVSGGSVMLIGDGIDAVEIPAQMPVGSLGPLLGRRRGSAGQGAEAREIAAGAEDREGSEAASEAASEAGSEAASGGSGGGLSRAAETVQAIVRLENQGAVATWQGRFARILGVDPTTRTLGVVVEVDSPRRRSSGPPLVPGLHVEVELRGAPREGCLLLPRSALHGDKVWVVGEEDRLSIREVTTSLVQEEFVCVEEGVSAGERVVVTDLTPAVEGMLLAPRADKEAVTRLRAIASGVEVAR